MFNKITICRFALTGLAAALLASTAGTAHAASIGLSTNYSVGYVALIEGVREAGGVTYNWDSNTLYVVGDEGEWQKFNPADGSYAGSTFIDISTYKDTEGVAYIGNNAYVLAQERTLELNKLSRTDDTWYPREKDSPTFCVDLCGNIGNEGLEGVSFDRTTGDFYAIKETNDQKVWRLTGLDFAGNGTVEELFDPAKLGLTTISDISVLSNSDAFVGTAMDDNLLILSATSEKLLEVNKAGDILSSFDLSGFDVETIEGVTVDSDGNIYLAAEQGPNHGLGAGLIKLSRDVPVPVSEPATGALMIGALGLLGAMRRRSAKGALA